MKRLDVASPDYHKFEIVESETGELCWFDEHEAEVNRIKEEYAALLNQVDMLMTLLVDPVRESVFGSMHVSSAIVKTIRKDKKCGVCGKTRDTEGE